MTHRSGGILANVTKAAGFLSIIPGPIGTAAGVVEVAGNLLQGHWKEAAWAAGGAVAAMAGIAGALKLAGAIKAAGIGQNAIKLSKVRKAKIVEQIGGGKYTKITEVRPGKGPGMSRSEYVRYKNQQGETIRTYKDTYDRADKFQHRKVLRGGPEGRPQNE